MIHELLSNTMYLKKSGTRIKNFTPIEKAEAFSYSQEIYDNHFKNGVPTKEEMLEILIEKDIWNDELENQYEEEIEKLGGLKVDYYDNFFIPVRKEELSIFIKLKEKKLNKLLSKKLYLSEYTCEQAMEDAYWTFLLAKYGDPFSLYRQFLLIRMSDEKIRSFYFDFKWRSIWQVCKDPKSIFGLDINHLNDNQISLLYWSKIYDNIQESIEPPPIQIMNDHLAVDGWMVKFSKSKEKPKNIGVNAGEVFLPARNKKEVVEINKLNNAHGRRVLKSRASDLAKNGDLDEGQFSFIKQEKQMEINRLNLGK